MISVNAIAWDDTVRPFQLDRSDIRGRVARLDGVQEGILKQHDYPPQVEALVAEMALLTALIGQTVALRWKLSLQVQSNGPVRMIATDYFAPEEEGMPARIRAYATFDADRLEKGAPFDQVGEGYFAILIDQGEGTTPYQGITPLAGGSLARCAEAYFAQSEQLPSRFSLSYGRSRQPGALSSSTRQSTCTRNACSRPSNASCSASDAASSSSRANNSPLYDDVARTNPASWSNDSTPDQNRSATNGTTTMRSATETNCPASHDGSPASCWR